MPIARHWRRGLWSLLGWPLRKVRIPAARLTVMRTEIFNQVLTKRFLPSHRYASNDSSLMRLRGQRLSLRYVFCHCRCGLSRLPLTQRLLPPLPGCVRDAVPVAAATAPDQSRLSEPASATLQETGERKLGEICSVTF